MTLGQNVPKLDALHLMDGIEGLRSLPKHSVDMLLTDPPYGTTRNFWDVPLPLPELWEAVRWAVKPNGAILFFAQCPFDKVLGASNLAMLRYEWVWYKSRATGFLNANRAPLKKSENILVFYQKSPVYHPQFTYGEPYRKTNPRSGCSTNYGKFERTGSESSDGRRYPGNVLFVPTVTGGIHPTQKPVELCEYFIKTYTDEGAVVADICAGSGTTAVAAMNTGRRFICFENAPSIYTIAAQRIEHGVDHRIEHTHRETRNEGADQIDAEAGHQTRKIGDADADEAYGHGSERRLLVADALEHQARRQTHEGVGDEIGRVAELRHEVRRAELVLDDDSHRVLEPRHEGDHRKEREHHRNGQNVVFFLCFHKVFQIGFLRYRLRSAT